MAGRGDVQPTDFGKRLRSLRVAAGLTRRELAATAGVHRNTIAKLERGEQEPAWPVVLKLAQALGVACGAFAGRPKTRKK